MTRMRRRTTKPNMAVPHLQLPSAPAAANPRPARARGTTAGGASMPHGSKARTNRPSPPLHGSPARLLQLDPAHLAAGADRRKAEALDPVGEPTDLDRVVDPDVGAVGDNEAGCLFIERLALGLSRDVARLAQQLVDLGVLIPG